MAKSRKCYLCGESYKYCNTCSSDKSKPAWMAEFHDENCKIIFDICTRFNMNLLSKDEAKEELLKCNLSHKSEFKDYVQRDIANIFAEPEQDSIEKMEKTSPATKATKTPVGHKTEMSHEVVNKTEK